MCKPDEQLPVLAGASELDPEVEALAEAYVELAAGNVRLALAVSVADRLETARLVSRGFARWGRPARRRLVGR